MTFYLFLCLKNMETSNLLFLAEVCSRRELIGAKVRRLDVALVTEGVNERCHLEGGPPFFIYTIGEPAFLMTSTRVLSNL